MHTQTLIFQHMQSIWGSHTFFVVVGRQAGWAGLMMMAVLIMSEAPELITEEEQSQSGQQPDRLEE